MGERERQYKTISCPNCKGHRGAEIRETKPDGRVHIHDECSKCGQSFNERIVEPRWRNYVV